MVATQQRAGLVSQQELLARELRDPEFRREWERTALAREVAARVIAYRAEHDLTQVELARRLGIPQPQVARLEGGEHNPSHSTLARLAARLGMEFTVNISSADHEPRQLTKGARDAPSARVERDGAILRYVIA